MNNNPEPPVPPQQHKTKPDSRAHEVLLDMSTPLFEQRQPSPALRSLMQEKGVLSVDAYGGLSEDEAMRLIKHLPSHRRP